jgi:glycosyltransferase involved in cell wall biosynthesis
MTRARCAGNRHPIVIYTQYARASQWELRMRILMISDVYFPRVNGVSTSIQTFRRCLHDAGQRTVLIAPQYPQVSGNADDADVVRVPSRYVPLDPEDRMMRAHAIRALKPQLANEKFDLIHIQTPFVAHYLGLELARHLNVPVIETYHTYFEEYLHHYVPLLPRALTRFAARRFTVKQCNALDGLVVPSSAMRAALEAYGVGCPMNIIPTGIDTSVLSGGDGARFRTQLNIAPGRPTLVHVGRVAHEKNIDFLFRMLVRLRTAIPNVLLIVAGEGPARGHCEHVVRDLGLADNVRFVGYLERAASLLDCYRAGDLFVFASKTETQGLVLLEAMALGVPVVSTAHMGTIDILRPQQGARIAPDDEQGFADLVAQLLKDIAERNRMSTAARAYAATWSAAAMAERLVELYRDVAKRPAVRRPPSAARETQSERLA